MKLLKGLNTDTAHVDQPGSTYRRARNMILDDLAGALSVEKGTAPISYFDNNFGGQRDGFKDYAVLGKFKVPGDRIIMALKRRYDDATDGNAEMIVEVTTIDAVYGGGNTLTKKAYGFPGHFGWDLEHPLQGVGYVNAAGETIVAWTDGDSTPKWLNLSSWIVGEEANLVFPEAKFPMTRPISFSAVQQDGEILGGAWSFMLAYEVVDGTNNLTQYGPAIGQFRIGNVSTDENAKYKTAIGLKFYGLDRRYNYVRVYGVRNYNGVETVHYCDRFRIQADNQEWEYLGQAESETDVPATDALYIPRANYTSAETLTVSDDRLFMANLTTDAITEIEGRTVANQIHMKWTLDQSGRHAAHYDETQLGLGSTSRVQNITNGYYVDAIPKRTSNTDNGNFRQSETKLAGMHAHDNFGLLGGFMPDNVYAFYIAFLMKDGTWSSAYHIPGGGDDGVYNTGAVSSFCSEVRETRNIAKIDGVTYNFRISGSLGHVTNANERYPSDYTEGVQGGVLAGEEVRHHLMPTPAQIQAASLASEGGFDDLNGGNADGSYTKEWANQHMSVFADNVIIPDSVADKVQGYKIFYAKSTINDRRVKAFVPTWAWMRYANLSSADPLYGQHNVDVNALRIYDQYILQNRPGDIDNWSVKEVYKNMTAITYAGMDIMKSSDVSAFAYVPNNITANGYDNELREAVLAISLDNSPTADNGWMAAWPGYFPGRSQGWANSIAHPTSGPIWVGQSAYDAVASYTNRHSGENGHGGNFASSFGCAHRKGNFTTSTQWYASQAVADKSSPFYGNTFVTAGAGAWKNSETETAGSSSMGVFYNGPGNMMSFIQLYCDKNDYYENFATQTLVATNDLVHTDGAGTYYSNQAINGGDTFISPQIVEFVAHRIGHDPDIEPINEQYSEAYEDQNNCELGKISYFTYTYLPFELADYRETENLTYFGAFSSDYGSGNTVNNFFEGQFLNDPVFGAHYYELNDNKSAFPHNRESLSVTDFPNRIVRSAKQGYESTQFAWSSFAPADYYDNALAKEQIRNLEDYKGELIIHHQNAIFKTRSKFNFDASGTDVFIGTGDIFQAPPLELFPDAAGYAGIAHWADSLLCRAGYTWVDREGKKVYMLGSGLEELSANGMRDYFRDDFCNIAAADARISDHTDGGGGYAIGYDPEFDRLFFTGVTWSTDGLRTEKTGETVSYSLRNKAWASMHDRIPTNYFQSYSSLYYVDDNNMRSYDNSQTTNDSSNPNFVFLFQVGNAQRGVIAPYYIPQQGAMPDVANLPNLTLDGTTVTSKSFVDVVFNMGGATPKVWQNFNWITRSGEGEGDLDDNLFENMTVYNDYQISDTAGVASLRKVDNRWNFNNFRDIATGTGSFFTADGFTFDTARQDNTKTWYNQGRFISEYAIIRLETLNTTGDSLYLTDVSSTARRAVR